AVEVLKHLFDRALHRQLVEGSCLGFHRATNPSSKAPEPPLDAGCSFLGGPRAQRVASAALHGARLDPSERCPPRLGYVPRASASAAAARRSGSGSCWLIHESVC